MDSNLISSQPPKGTSLHGNTSHGVHTVNTSQDVQTVKIGGLVWARREPKNKVKKIQEGQHLLTGQRAANFCLQRTSFQWGSVPLRSDIKSMELPPANILIPLERQLIALQLCH